MKNIGLLLTLIAIMLSTSTFAQRTSDVEGSSDYRGITRFEGSFIEFYRVTKWDEYKIPLNFETGYLDWEEPAIIEGSITRIQYSASAENNPNYTLRVLKASLQSDGYTIVYAKNNQEMGISPGTFSDKFYGNLGNKKFGFAYGTSGKDQALIIAKTKKGSKDVYVVVYISGFDNTTLITMDVVKAETFKQNKVIATVYRGSQIYFTDKMGYNEFEVCVGKTADGKMLTKKVEGYINLRFVLAPEGISDLELIKNYEQGIQAKGGKIFVSNKGRGKCVETYLASARSHKNDVKYDENRNEISRYLSGIISTDSVDYYIIVTSGYNGNNSRLYYSILTITTKPMKQGMVSVDNINTGLESDGHIAIYGIHFESGKSAIMSESDNTLKVIADYLNSHPDDNYIVVGHTDNTGDFTENQKLSLMRANAVITELTTKYNVKADQLTAFGASSSSPISSNSTEKGRAKNRRVEIVKK